MESKPLMFDAMLREHYERRLDLLRRALTGVATNATQCGACRMLNEIATEALERDAGMAGHAPGCLSLDNVLGRHGCDCGGR